MKVADNLDMHEILDKFEFRQDHFRVTCPSGPKKKKTFDFVQSVACVIFIQSL